MTFEQSDFYVGDIGNYIEVTVYKNSTEIMDISTATTKILYFRKPDGTVINRTATFFTDGSDGILKYAWISGDLDVEGNWYFQVYIETPGEKKSSSWVPFKVGKVLR
jgi:hypothetical protein